MTRNGARAHRSTAAASRSSGSGGAECVMPASADTAQECRIDNQLADGVDQSHVDRRKATDAAHVDAEIEAVRMGCFDESAQRPGVGGAIDQLQELLVFEAIHDAEHPLARARRCQGLRAIGGRQTRGERFPRGGSRLTIPTEVVF